LWHLVEGNIRTVKDCESNTLFIGNKYFVQTDTTNLTADTKKCLQEP